MKINENQWKPIKSHQFDPIIDKNWNYMQLRVNSIILCNYSSILSFYQLRINTYIQSIKWPNQSIHTFNQLINTINQSIQSINQCNQSIHTYNQSIHSINCPIACHPILHNLTHKLCPVQVSLCGSNYGLNWSILGVPLVRSPMIEIWGIFPKCFFTENRVFWPIPLNDVVRGT